MKKKIFVTGISSSIMQRLIAQMDRSEYEFIGISRKTFSPPSDNIKIVKGDLLEIEEFSPYLEDCHMILHGAAVTHAQKEEEYYKVNLEATQKLVEASKKYKVSRFVFISSNTAGKESGAYGLTKLLGEEYIQKNLSNWTILRLSEVYGDSKKEGIEKLIHSVLESSLVLCPTGIPTKFYPIHVSDATQMMYKKIIAPEDVNKISVINGAEGFSFKEVIELTEKIAGKKVKVIYLTKKIMMLIKWVAGILPINLGIAPDQVDRLYSVKHIEPAKEVSVKLEDYIKGIV